MVPSKNWKNHYKVHSFLCNRHGHLRVASIARFFQESAWEHAEHCGAGYETLKPYGLIWILHGLRMEIRKFPAWNDNLQVETWGKKYETLFAYRDFYILMEEEDEPVVRATSSWLLVDAQSHRPQRITEKLHKIPQLEHNALEVKPGNIQLPEVFDKAEEIKVRYSDIDIYNHVNNTSYIQFCMDISEGLQEKASNIKTFDIRFVQETHLGESLIVKQGSDDQGIYFSGRNSENGKETFRAMAEV